MKKHFKKIALIATLTASTGFAQTTADFQNLALSTGTFYNGSTNTPSVATSTSFTSGNCIFNTKWSGGNFPYWEKGWAYSNMTNTITAGLGNLYSAYAGSGFNNSTNYAVGQSNSVLKFNTTAQSKQIAGFYITNGTYAGISMRDGDQFAKKFGGVSGNDPDWFKLKVQKYLNGVLVNDSVTFYLADFRFTNNTQDYIVNTWQYVDVTSLGNADSLIFKLTSSDVGNFGMNTPAFFCIDNITTLNSATSVFENKNHELGISLFPNPATTSFTIKSNSEIELVNLYDITGKLKNTFSTNSISTEGLQKGIYFIEAVSMNGIRTTKKIILE